MKTKALLTLAALTLLSGCALNQVSSKIQMPGAGALTLPKDSKFSTLDYRQEPVMLTSNLIGYRVTLVITNGNFSMNPAVIDRATAHDVGLMNAGGQLIIQGMGLATPGK